MESHIQYLTALFPNIATQIRSGLNQIHLASLKLAPADVRESDPALDAKAALLDQGYFQLLHLVNDLSSAVHLGNDGPLPLQDWDVVDVVRTVCDQADSLTHFLDLKLQFICDMDQHVCAINRDGIEQLLFNLLSNAFKFTPPNGSIVVELKLVGGQLLLTVTDTGCGITEALLPTLFNRFLHQDLMSPPPHGLGLGLPLCRRIAKGHGGSIMAESKPEKGSRFTLSLPDKQVGITGLSDIPFDYAGGFNRTLLALSDALPKDAFLLRNEE